MEEHVFEDIKSAIEKELSKDDSCIYKVNNELSNYLYDDTGVFIPYTSIHEENKEIFLKISRNENKKSELIFTWGKYNHEKFQTLTIFRSDKLINEENKKLIDNLTTIGINAGLKIDEKELKTFINDIKREIVQSNCLSVLKEIDFDFSEYAETEENEEDEIANVKFSDYDEIIQEESLKMLKQDTLFDNILFSISLTHEGNKELKEQLPLILSSVFIDQPVHTELNADTGVGKTDILIETSKNYPSYYIHILRNISPKNIYYDKDSYGSFNILIFDDVVLTEPMIEIIKELADNNKPVKELKTVIDGKSKTFTLNGKFLVILTYAKQNPDEELLNRLYKLNIIIEEDGDKSAIKQKIQENAVIDSDNNEIIKRSRLIIQAGIQYLIEMKITVFNPFTLLFDPKELNNRNIKAFITLVKCKTFFHVFNRKNIEINGTNIYIGSYSDFTFVDNLWAKSAKTQEYKLNDKDMKILEYLPLMTREEAYEHNESALKQYNDAKTKKEKDEIIENEYTRRNIAKATGIMLRL